MNVHGTTDIGVYLFILSYRARILKTFRSILLEILACDGSAAVLSPLRRILKTFWQPYLMTYDPTLDPNVAKPIQYLGLPKSSFSRSNTEIKGEISCM